MSSTCCVCLKSFNERELVSNRICTDLICRECLSKLSPPETGEFLCCPVCQAPYSVKSQSELNENLTIQCEILRRDCSDEKTLIELLNSEQDLLNNKCALLQVNNEWLATRMLLVTKKHNNKIKHIKGLMPIKQIKCAYKEERETTGDAVGWGVRDELEDKYSELTKEREAAENKRNDLRKKYTLLQRELSGIIDKYDRSPSPRITDEDEDDDNELMLQMH